MQINNNHLSDTNRFMNTINIKDFFYDYQIVCRTIKHNCGFLLALGYTPILSRNLLTYSLFTHSCISTPGKKGFQATWKLDLHVPKTDNGTSTRLAPVPCPLQCLHKGTGRSEQQWFKPGAYACNVYTKGLADLNSNGLSQVLTLAMSTQRDWQI